MQLNRIMLLQHAFEFNLWNEGQKAVPTNAEILLKKNICFQSAKEGAN